MATATTPMTPAELLAMPDDGTDRWLIRGELREQPMTVRNRFHTEVTALVSAALVVWMRGQAGPRGKVHAGEAGVRLPGDPATLFGIDLVYVSADVSARQSADTTVIEGVPTLAVEILSPSDTQEDIDEKIEVLLDAGVPLVWIVNPRWRTVTVHRPGAEPETFNARQELTAEPHLPGFRVAVAALFE